MLPKEIFNCVLADGHRLEPVFVDNKELGCYSTGLEVQGIIFHALVTGIFPPQGVIGFRLRIFPPSRRTRSRAYTGNTNTI